jgi:predicted nuclease of predicted toxin-antitoxin system
MPGSMRLLLHGNLTLAVADALRAREDTVRQLSDVGLAPDAPADEVIKAAHKDQAEILTTDVKLANALFARDDAPKFNRSIVYFQLEGGDVEQDDAVDRLFERYKRLTPGRLYTVTGSRVKVRQLPQRS